MNTHATFKRGASMPVNPRLSTSTSTAKPRYYLVILERHSAEKQHHGCEGQAIAHGLALMKADSTVDGFHIKPVFPKLKEFAA